MEGKIVQLMKNTIVINEVISIEDMLIDDGTVEESYKIKLRLSQGKVKYMRTIRL